LKRSASLEAEGFDSLQRIVVKNLGMLRPEHPRDGTGNIAE
jgi:hypothetical protein